MSKKKINFAIIGCGSVSLDHANVIKKLGHNIIFGTTSKKHSKNWKKFKKVNNQTQFSSIEKILKDKKVDMIISCLPLSQNIKYCSKLIFSDKPILIEKPLHNNFKKLYKILKDPRAKLSNKVLAYNRRYYDVVSKLKKKIHISKVKMVNVNISENYKVLKKKYKRNLNKIFLHVGASSHIIDLLSYFFRKIKVLKKIKFKDKYLNNFQILLIANKKIPISVNINHNDSLNASIDIRFEKGNLWQLSPIEKLKIFGKPKILKSNKNFYKKEYVSNLINSFEENKNFRPGFFNQMKMFSSKNFMNMYKIKENLKLIKLFNEIEK